MFKILSKVVSYTWGVVTSSRNPEDIDSSDEEEEIHNKVNSYYEEQDVWGTITEINKLERFGVIDQNIFFSFDQIYGARYPRVGLKVSAKIHRDTPDQNWKATNVTIVDEIWDLENGKDYCKDEVKNGASVVVDSQNAKKKAIISTVKSVSNLGVVTTRDGIEFNFKNMQFDFIPRAGDVLCLTCLVDSHYQDETQIIDFKSTRSGTVEGEITQLNISDGVINDEVWFAKASCDRNYSPKKGDKVVAQTVEQNLGKYMWRATHVTPVQIKSSGYNNNYKNHKIVPKLNSRLQNSVIQELLNDKQNISITNNLTFGEVELNHKTYLTAWIVNNGMESQKLLNCRFKMLPEDSNNFVINKAVLYQENSTLSNDNNDESELVIIPPGERAFVNIICNSTCVGRSKSLLFFQFEKFAIGRYVEAEVTTGLQFQNGLLPSTPYRKVTYGNAKGKQQELIDKSANNFVINGVAPYKGPSNVPVKLGLYPIPKNLWRIILDNDDEDLFKLMPFLAEELTKDNYSDRFSALLHLEEIQLTLDMRRYDMRDVCLSRSGEFIKLTVPGLAEGRPSLLVGDQVLLTNPEEDNTRPVYTGFIHELVFPECFTMQTGLIISRRIDKKSLDFLLHPPFKTLRSDILIKFNPTFHCNYGGESYNVAFQCSRTRDRRCHQAVNQVVHIDKEIIFPTVGVTKPPVVSILIESETTENKTLSNLLGTKIMNGEVKNGMKKGSSESKSLKWFNKELNERQKSAVKRIVENQARPLPYVVFGPPGTGKTVTLVESVLQVFKLIKNSRILIAAPSNSAADLITLRLHDSGQVDDSNLARLNAYSRFKQEELIPEAILKYCKSTHYDSISNVAFYRIIISTCSTIGCLYTLGLNVKHFTHAFIDEAGQATEPETMVIIGLVAIGGGQVVLAGDHKQLGPVIRSTEAKAYGLDYSMLERIMDRFPYQRDDAKFNDHGNFDPFLVTKLIKNYRSHHSILKVFSTRFYHGELVPLAKPDIINVFNKWDGLLKANFPIVFNGVRGENFREDTSPSWFNPVEVVQVVRYLKSLYEFGISPDDIGIITPYKKQCEKIKFLMDSLEMEPCKVGSVEEFQGQEFLVIIISTVRTCPDLLQYDLTHNLGFISNPKRFNVAVSRAIALLIVIGDPFLLSKDDNWGYLLQYCIKNGSYDGTEFNSL